MCCVKGGMCSIAGNRGYVLCDSVLHPAIGGMCCKIGGMFSTAGNRGCVL